MQTTFTPAQLKNPGTQRANEILRTCVHCGFCTATCPTYQVLDPKAASKAAITLKKKKTPPLPLCCIRTHNLAGR